MAFLRGPEAGVRQQGWHDLQDQPARTDASREQPSQTEQFEQRAAARQAEVEKQGSIRLLGVARRHACRAKALKHARTSHGEEQWTPWLRLNLLSEIFELVTEFRIAQFRKVMFQHHGESELRGGKQDKADEQ